VKHDSVIYAKCYFIKYTVEDEVAYMMKAVAWKALIMLEYVQYWFKTNALEDTIMLKYSLLYKKPVKYYTQQMEEDTFCDMKSPLKKYIRKYTFDSFFS
jgi:hypothetical protein